LTRLRIKPPEESKGWRRIAPATMSDDRPNYGEAIMNAVSIEAKAVLAYMDDVRKMRALSAEVEPIDPALAAETRELNLQVARCLRRQRKLLPRIPRPQRRDGR
jgi:hypothetical protein